MGMANQIRWTPPGRGREMVPCPDGRVGKIGQRPDGTRYLWQRDEQDRWYSYLLVPLSEGEAGETYRACTGHVPGTRR
jgi:hypothetical protein